MPMTQKPNLPRLREAWRNARDAWLTAVYELDLDEYSDEAGGKLVGRGKNKQPDALRVLFDKMEAARAEYQGGGE